MASLDDLKFHEFEVAAALLSADPSASTISVTTSSPAPVKGDVKLEVSEEERAQEEHSELPQGEKQAGGFWTFEYYQSFFNVDTMQVLDRIRGSVTPLPGRNFIKLHIRGNPDLYGPFWICATLVFSMAVSGNLSTFLSHMGQPQYHYRPQFHRVTVAGVAVFVYAWLVPLCVWGFLTWRRNIEAQISGYSFLETVCVYGYSLFIYVPTSVLWMIPLDWLQWLLIVVATVISGTLLIVTFWPAVRDDTKPAAIATMTAIVLLHSLLAIGCKLYFFQTMATTAVITSPTAAPITRNHVTLLTTISKKH